MDYITSKFYANARYTSSIFYTLKFFFEKNTKHLHALDKLGSVYRSSKWVGLKLRNVDSTSLLRWYLAAALGLILCYFIINPSSFVPAVATSAVHTLTQSAWQLLQYWKVGSITLFAATIKLGAQLLFERLGRQMASLFFGQVTCTTTRPTPSSLAQEPNTSVASKGYRYFPSTSAQYCGNWMSRQQLVLPWVIEFYKFQKVLSRSAVSFHSLGLGTTKYYALLHGLLSARYHSRSAQSASLSLYTTVSSFLDEPLTELPYIAEVTYSICRPQAARDVSNLSRATFSAPLDQGTLWRLTTSSERSVLSNVGANLTLAKENRWLWRSNMFSNRLSAQLSSLVQMRTYINNPLFSSLFLNKSIWLSTRASGSADLQLLNLGDRSFVSSMPLLTCSGGKSTQANLNFLGDSILWSLSRFSTQQSMYFMQHVTFTSAGGTKRVRPNSSSFGLCFPRVNPLFLDYGFVTGDLYSSIGTSQSQLSLSDLARFPSLTADKWDLSPSQAFAPLSDLLKRTHYIYPDLTPSPLECKKLMEALDRQFPLDSPAFDNGPAHSATIIDRKSRECQVEPGAATARLEGFDDQLLLRREVATVLSGCFASAPKKSLPLIYFSNL